jgi:hypothetical protein
VPHVMFVSLFYGRTFGSLVEAPLTLEPSVLICAAQANGAIFNSRIPSQELTEVGDRVLYCECPITPSEPSHRLLMCLGSSLVTRCVAAFGKAVVGFMYTATHVSLAEACLPFAQSANVLNIYVANLNYAGQTIGWSTYPWNWNNPIWCASFQLHNARGGMTSC